MTTTKAKLPPALVELLADPEAHRAERHLLDLARELHDEGMSLRAVGRGLAGALVKLIDDNCMNSEDEFLEAKHFLCELEKGFGFWREDFENIEDVANEIERSRAAGGTGNPYQ